MSSNKPAVCSKLLESLSVSLGTIVAEVCMDLSLPANVIATACKFWHTVFPSHFYLFELTHSPEVISESVVACVFLSGKVMEKARRLRDVISSVEYCKHKLKNQTAGQLLSSADSPPADSSRTNQQSSRLRCDGATSSASSLLYEPMDMKTYWHKRDGSLKEENRLLKALGFVGAIPCRVFELLTEALLLVGWTPQQSPRHVTLAFGVLNDIVVTSMTCRYSEEVLVVAVILLVERLFGQSICSAGTLVSATSAAETTADGSWRTSATRHLEKLNSLLAMAQGRVCSEIGASSETLYVCVGKACDEMFSYWKTVNRLPLVRRTDLPETVL
eukprot:GHVS01096664.1.p1 GENE.GHVS01096664.1~~GHVS01096664.1.p1  ORF type:complete len:330 (-),score=44.59 GHVS01096664.1:312-1301(-)